MKKFLISVLAFTAISGSAYAIEIDPSSAKAQFTGFKMMKRVGATGTIENANFDFKVVNASTVEILNNVEMNMDFANFSTKDKTRDKNITRTLVASLDDSKISAKLKNVSGDDESGNAIAIIDFNNASKEIPVTYEVKDSRLVVKGSINMNTDFNLAKAYAALSNDKQIAALHGKKTWEDVEIFFSVDVK